MHNYENICAISLRGTASKENIWTDAKAYKTTFPQGSPMCKVHKGIYNHYLQMKDALDVNLRQCLQYKPNALIVVTGHSLGGAVAHFMGYHIFDLLPQRQIGSVKVITFGSPRVGNIFFASLLNSKIGLNNIERVSYIHDPVANNPLKRLGYYHCGLKFVCSSSTLCKLVPGPDIGENRFWRPWDKKYHSAYFQITKNCRILQ